LSPELVLRNYFHAKDENRPHLLASVFSPEARLEIRNRSDQISFPATTVGLEGIADVLVRRFNQAYENIYSFYLERPRPSDEFFSCDWLVGMTDKQSRSVRVGCGRYDWTFQRTPAVLATRLIITIEVMLVLDESRASAVLGWLKELGYPWTSAADVNRTLPPRELAPVGDYLGRRRPSAIGLG
jgi:hypothetical protein